MLTLSILGTELYNAGITRKVVTITSITGKGNWFEFAVTLQNTQHA